MIYILEDDDSIRELVCYSLQTSGLEIIGFSTPSAMWTAMQTVIPELLILDIMLPEEDGLSVLRKLRSKASTRTLPVILLTAKNTEYDKVTGLDAGADDYISKPFGMMELMSRVKALLRRTSNQNHQQEFGVGCLTLCLDSHRVLVDGNSVTLTRKEFQLLALLLQNLGRVFTREQLLDEIWGYVFNGESRTVDVHIRTLRQKLGVAGKYIETVRGIGYRATEEKQ